MLSLPGLWVQSLVGELRPHKPSGAAKNIKNLGFFFFFFLLRVVTKESDDYQSIEQVINKAQDFKLQVISKTTISLALISSPCGCFWYIVFMVSKEFVLEEQ